MLAMGQLGSLSWQASSNTLLFLRWLLPYCTHAPVLQVALLKKSIKIHARFHGHRKDAAASPNDPSRNESWELGHAWFAPRLRLVHIVRSWKQAEHHLHGSMLGFSYSSAPQSTSFLSHGLSCYMEACFYPVACFHGSMAECVR